MQKKLKPGDKFGKLTVMHWQKDKKSWRCKCDCGGETNAYASSLKSGRHKSCACGKTALRPNAWKPENYALKESIRRNYEKSAKRKGHSWELDREQFFSYIDKPCAYCGTQPQLKWFHRDQDGKIVPERFIFYNGVDRVDNNQGYTTANCVPCCSVCNNSKSALSLEQWKAWLQKVNQRMFNDYPNREYTQVGGNGQQPDIASQVEDIV